MNGRRTRRLPLVWALGFSLLLPLAACGGGGGIGTNVPNLVSIVTTSLPAGLTGVDYSASIEIQVSHPPGVVNHASGTIPPGLKLDTMNGTLTGFPRQLGNFTFTLVARDGVDTSLPAGRDVVFAEDRQTFVVTIGRGPVNLVPQTVAPAEYRNTYAYQFDVAGGTAPYTFQVTGGTLPAGISLLPTGLLSGLATQAQPDPYEFQVTVTDANGETDTDTFELIVVVLPLVIGTSSPLPDGAQDFPYDVPITLAIRGAGAPYTWTQVPPTGGEVPLSSFGMEIGSNGHLRNSFAYPGPTAVGTFRFTLQVTDEGGQVAQRSYQMDVNPGPVLAKITPSKAAQPGPYLATGLNFQAGAKLVFEPGANQVEIVPTFVNSTTLSFSSAPAQPTGSRGFVPVRVVNPDGGYHEIPAGFAWPLTTVSFSTTPYFPSTQSSLSSTGIAVGDLNKDGRADAVHCGSGTAAYYWGDSIRGSAGGVDLMLNTYSGTGPYSASFSKITLDTNEEWHQVALGDLDNDGDLDIVAVGRIAGQLRARVWLNPYPAAYTTSTPYLDSVLPFRDSSIYGYNHISGMALGQLTTPDTALDIVYTEQGTYTTSGGIYGGGSVVSVRGNGNGTFATSALQVFSALQATQISQISSVAGVGLGSLNADTTDDISISDQMGGFVAFQFGGTYGNNGCWAITNPSTGLFGSWSPLYRSTSGGYEFLDTAIADFSGDGSGDIVYTIGGSIWVTPQYAIAGHQGNGSGSFSTVNPESPSGNPFYRYLAAFDANYDLPMDLVASADAGRLMIWTGRTGTQGLQARQTIQLASGTVQFGRVATGDFDGDGDGDVCATLSFLADRRQTSYSYIDRRGLGSPQGFVIFLNTSN